MGARPRPRPGIVLLLAAAVWALAAAGAASASASVATENVTATLLAERARVAAGDRLELALVLDIRPGWHTYWRHPGDSGEPPRIRWRLPEGVEAGPIRWPVPQLIRVGPLANYGYSGRVVHLISLRTPADWPIGEPLAVDAEATWLVCEEACIPERGSFSLRLETADVAGPADPDVAGLFAEARASLPVKTALPARAQVDGGALTLRVPAASLPGGVTEARFFAGAWGLIEHAAPQDWRLDGDDLVLDLTAGPAPEAAQPSGLLVIANEDERLGFELQADWAAPSAEPATQTFGPADRYPGIGLPVALLLGLLGGIVLNLMPCVFPVLAIKVLGLIGQRGAPVHDRLFHALAYTAGVLTFFAVVAASLLGLRAAGVAAGWGFQLQSPPFVALLVYLFLVLGLSFAGAVQVGGRLMGLGAVGPSRGLGGAFATGALAALVAAPCTAPFMGTALGYAITQPASAAFAIMLSVGLGMALPFVGLLALPRLADRLPRPGAWMERLKQFLAFPMFGTAAWLVWVLGVQTGPSGIGAVLAGSVILALALWLLEQARDARSPWRQTAKTAALGGLVAALWLGTTTVGLAPGPGLASSRSGQAAASGVGRVVSDGPRAEPFSEAALAAARAEGRPVFVNMTAAWCITCLVNERVALSSKAVARVFEARDMLYLKGDWTNGDPAITDYLAGFGRNGVPIYVLYPADGEPRVLPQLLTESIVLNALEET